MGKHIEDIAQSDSEGCQKQIKDALANPFHSFSSHLFLIIKHRQSSDHQKGKYNKYINIYTIPVRRPPSSSHLLFSSDFPSVANADSG